MADTFNARTKFTSLLEAGDQLRGLTDRFFISCCCALPPACCTPGSLEVVKHSSHNSQGGSSHEYNAECFFCDCGEVKHL